MDSGRSSSFNDNRFRRESVALWCLRLRSISSRIWIVAGKLCCAKPVQVEWMAIWIAHLFENISVGVDDGEYVVK